AFINLDLWTLLLFAEAILYGEIMHAEQRLQNSKILHVSIDPVKPFFRGDKCFINILNSRKHSIANETNFHPESLLSFIRGNCRLNQTWPAVTVFDSSQALARRLPCPYPPLY